MSMGGVCKVKGVPTINMVKCKVAVMLADEMLWLER